LLKNHPKLKNMPKNDKNNTIRHALEVAAEVIAVILIVLPFFQSQDSIKKK